MTKKLRKEVLLDHAPEDVWVALTDPHALAEWLMPNNFKPELGAKFRFQVDPMMGLPGYTDCEVLEFDPPKRMTWSWHVGVKEGKKRPPAMNVSWTLSPEGEKTRLVLEQTGLENLPFWFRISMGFGWGTMLNRWIPKVLANVENGAFAPGAIPLKKRCYGVKTIPPDMVR